MPFTLDDLSRITVRLGTGRKALARARQLLTRDSALIDERARHELSSLLREHPALAAIYQAKLDLLEVWQQRTRGAQELLAALREWCERAEQSGNEALRDFAAYLRSYSPAGALA